MFTAIQIYRQTAIYTAQSDTTIQPGLGYRYTHTFYTICLNQFLLSIFLNYSNSFNFIKGCCQNKHLHCPGVNANDIPNLKWYQLNIFKEVYSVFSSNHSLVYPVYDTGFLLTFIQPKIPLTMAK